MKTILTSLIALLSVVSQGFAQVNGQFYTAQDGHIYFQGLNTTGNNFYVTISAASSDHSNSETIAIGQGFVLGPSTPWQWYWKQGDRITLTYPNGQSTYWTCPLNDKAYASSTPSFRGTNSDGYIYKGTIDLTRVGSRNKETFFLFNKDGINYVATSKSGPFHRLSKRMSINNINYTY